MKNRKMNRDMPRSVRIVALVAITVHCANGCSGSTGSGAAQSPPPAATYNISTQSDYDAAKLRIYDGGDEILFARGRSFEGAFSLRRSRVRPDSTITVADYGSGNDARPVIVADAEGMGVIDIRDSGGWTIENLELVNQSATRSERMGVYVFAADSGFHQDFVVRNCLVHDVTGEPGNKDNGGIIFRVRGNTVPTKFDNILLENNEIRDISGVGIRIKSPWEADPSDPRQGSNEIGRHAFQNVVVRGNRVSNITKNAIIVASSDAPLVEYNVMGPNISTEFTGNSFFNFATDNALVQYNEAFGNTGPASDHDRGGFDADWNARNTVFRYNYSHDNNYAFAIMRRYHDGMRIHHNISENDRYGFFLYGFPNENRISNMEVRNNTFYSMYPDMQMFMNVGRQRDPVNTTFVDNIFVFAAGGATWGFEPTAELGNVFDNNLVFGLDEAGYTGPAGDPSLAAPGTGGTYIDMSDPGRLAGYKLCIGSPAIGAGQNASSPSGVDHWGDESTSANIGAYGGNGVDCTSLSGHSQPMHIFLLAGQSNMAGRGEPEETDRTPHRRIFALNKHDEWVIATEPLHFDKPRISGTGPGLAFAQEIAKRNPGIRIGLVPTAVGGSGIQSWEPGGYHEQTGLYPWDDAVRRLGIATQAGELKAILWHQGEADSAPESASLYEARLHDLIRRFRDAAGNDELPFIVGQLGHFKEWSHGRRLVNAVHENVPTQFEQTKFVSSDGLNHTGDNTHFDAPSARELGRRYAKAYADILQTTPQ
jgi:hypothetical protein